MEYVKFGQTGIKVSPLCLGTMNFPYRTPEDEAIDLIHAAIDKGVNFIDTANMYGRPANDTNTGHGLTEKLLAKALEGKRDRIILATKVRATMYDDPNGAGLSRRHIMEQVEASLKRLNTDYIDLYQMHAPDPDTPIEETLRTMDDLVSSGKVRYIGTSNFTGWRLIEALWTSDKHNYVPIVSEQPLYNILVQHRVKDVLPVAEKYNIALMPWSPLAGGFLTGKYKRNDVYPNGTRLADKKWNEWSEHFFLTEKTFDVVELVEAMAHEKGCTMTQLSLAWLLHQKTVTSPIIGPRTMAQLEDNLGALEVDFTDDDFARIQAVAN